MAQTNELYEALVEQACECLLNVEIGQLETDSIEYHHTYLLPAHFLRI